ncbi:MAG: hypothetical protein ACJ75J_09770 [Cytophagaceae bacterium]
MSYQNVSYVMPQADIDAVKAAIATINSKMPFLITLSEDEKKTLFKMGPKSVDFVQDCLTAVQGFPGILPANFNTVEFTKDGTLVKSLVDIGMQLDSLSEKVNDTLMAVGSEAMASSLQVYSYVRVGADHTPGLKSVEEKMNARFKRHPRKKSSETTPV